MSTVCTDEARTKDRFLQTPDASAIVVYWHTVTFWRDFMALENVAETTSLMNKHIVKASFAEVDIVTLEALISSAPDWLDTADVAAVVLVKDVLFHCVLELEVVRDSLPSFNYYFIKAVCTQVEVRLSP
mmetsp:Transcript_19291/g.35464  ORF Transcript_19291/g.35464 Transcript_19291/m.35464 type:complete len:129 (-) Transcript_19291:2768-3154(-)